MAATGLLAAVLWFSGAGLVLAAGVGTETVGFILSAGLFFVPFAVVTSFAVGTALWRRLYPAENRELYGALFGGITALSGLAVGAVGLAVLLAASNVLRGEMGLLEAASFATLLTPVGFLAAVAAAGWLVVPVGVFGGWYHERAKAAPQ